VKAESFLNQLKHDDIVAAIREAEIMTSGEIRVFISRKTISDPVEVAKEHFVRLKMTETLERNGVLIFVAPAAQKFAVIGDVEVHKRCGHPFWTELTKEMSGHFRESKFSQGIIHGVKKAGKLLAEHFPRRPDDKNELPDEVERD
jgi:uncharacterized membrane protein